MSVGERFQIAKSKQVCFNCLQQGHTATWCSSKFKYRECKRMHRTLPHWPQNTLTHQSLQRQKKTIGLEVIR